MRSPRHSRRQTSSPGTAVGATLRRSALLPRFEGALVTGQRGQRTIAWSAIAVVRWEAHGADPWFVIGGVDGSRLDAIDARQVPNQGILAVVLSRFGRYEGEPNQRHLGDVAVGAVRGLFAS